MRNENSLVRREYHVSKRKNFKHKKKFIVQYMANERRADSQFFSLFSTWQNRSRHATMADAEKSAATLNKSDYYGDRMFKYRVVEEGKEE